MVPGVNDSVTTSHSAMSLRTSSGPRGCLRLTDMHELRAVEVRVVAGVVEVRAVVHERADAAKCLRVGARFDADDFRAVVGEVLGDGRADAHPGEVGDAQAGERLLEVRPCRSHHHPHLRRRELGGSRPRSSPYTCSLCSPTRGARPRCAHGVSLELERRAGVDERLADVLVVRREPSSRAPASCLLSTISRGAEDGRPAGAARLRPGDEVFLLAGPAEAR